MCVYPSEVTHACGQTEGLQISVVKTHRPMPPRNTMIANRDEVYSTLSIASTAFIPTTHSSKRAKTAVVTVLSGFEFKRWRENGENHTIYQIYGYGFLFSLLLRGWGGGWLGASKGYGD